MELKESCDTELGLSLGRYEKENKIKNKKSFVNGGSMSLSNSGLKKQVKEDHDDYEEEDASPRKKLRLTKHQSAALENVFKKHITLHLRQKQALAEQLNLRPRQVEVWFQNKRARTKQKQTEGDYESLKKCRETLIEENKRLQKEVQELRSFKPTAKFYMQHPAAALTMCPSCCQQLGRGGKPTTGGSNSRATVANNIEPKAQFFLHPFSHHPFAAC